MKTRKLMTACLLVLLLALAAVLGLTGCSDEEICEHQWGEWSVTKEATCSAAGAKERACSLCSKVQSAEIAALPHDWNAATCTTPKTCKVCAMSEGGALGHIGGVATCKEKAACTICGTAYGELNPNNHASNGAWTPVSSAKHSQTCADCNTVYEKAHIWSNGKCVACSYVCQHTWVGSTCTGCGATCQHTGGTASCTQRAVCDICDLPYGELLAHDYKVENTSAAYRATAATCDNAATYYYSCDCGAKGSTTFTYGDPLGHTYGDWTSNGDGTHTRTCVNDAGHTESGRCSGGEATCTEKAICDLCHEGYGEEPSHDWNEGTETDAPSCLEAGKKLFSCTCGATKEEPIAALGHDMESVVTDPTCTTKGYTTHTCQRGECGISYVDTEVDALGHDWDRERDCENGHTCQRGECGATEAALGHDYQETDFTEATCENAAYYTYTCSVCGDSYDNPDGDPNGHSITGVTPTRVLKEGETCVYIQYYKCTVCLTDVPGTEVTNHDMTTAITRPATCVTPGEKLRSCTKCDYADPAEPIPADSTGHAWTEGEVVNGERTDTCSNPDCGATKTVVVYDGSATNAGNLADKEVELNGANINLGSDVANTIGDQDITLSAGKTEGDDRMDLGLSPEELAQVGNNPIYDFTITGANGPISQFGEENYVTITLPYTLTEGEDVDNIAVWFINDEGGLTSIKATYNNGYVTFRTNHFSYYTVTRLTPAQRCELYQHAWSEKPVDGDCLNDSYTLKICARCHKTEKTITVEADGHNYECVTTPATCTTAGKNVYTCTDCGASYETKIKATGHAFAETENVPATCAAPGHITKTCQNGDCGATETVTYAQLKHVFSDTVVPPTCEAYGYTLHDCDNCDYSYTDTNVAAIGHSYEATFAWTDTTAAVATLTCANDATHTFELEATITSRVIESTCPAGNRTVYTAKVVYNGVAYTDVSAVQSGNGDHQFNTAKYDATAHWTECVCGAKNEITPHVWGNPTVIESATCAKDGKSVTACACGATNESKIPATGNHIYDNGYCIECGAEKGAGCDHTELHEVTYDLSDYGCCAGFFTVLSCECGEVVYATDMEGEISCDMDEVEEDEGITEDGNMYMSMKAVCATCGLTVDIYAEAVLEGCQITATYQETISIGGEVVLVATMIETGTDHNSERVEIDMSEYGCCGGILTVYRCADCGEISNVADLDIDCDGEMVQSTETVDGITYMVATQTCPDCGLVGIQKMGVESISPCEERRHVILILQMGDTVIVEYRDTMYSESSHEWQYSYVQNGATCEDGWTCTQHCAKCGTTRTYRGNNHDTEYTQLDLTDYGMCGGSADAEICRLCGHTEVYNVNDYACHWSYSDSSSDNDSGIVIKAVLNTVVGDNEITDKPSTILPGIGSNSGSIMTCMRCGTVREYSHYESEKDENCQYTVVTAATYTRDGEVVFSYERTGFGTDHSWEYDSVMNGASCEDGVTITVTCKDCGYSYTEQTRDHQTLRTEYDLSDYGACGGYVAIYACPCGLYQSFDWNLDCHYRNEGSGYTDDNGIRHNTETYTCKDCGLVMERDHYNLTEGCDRVYHYTVTVKVGDTVVLDNYTYERREPNHTWEYDFEMKGDSCEDGVEVDMTCTVCGETSHDSWDGHRTVQKRVDLPDGTCGGYISIYTCACGEEGWLNREVACKLSYGEPNTYTDGEGIEHSVYTLACDTCGLVFVEDTYSYTEGCYEYHRGFMTVKLGETVLLNNQPYSDGYSSNHDYAYSYRFMGEENCEQGVFVTQTCTRCDYYSEYETHGHSTHIVERFDLSEAGGCDGELIYRACPCGWMKDTELNTNCNLTWTENEYLDPENGEQIYTNGCPTFVRTNACHTCGLRYQDIFYTSRDASACRAVTYHSVTVVVGANAVAALEYQTSAPAHNYAVSGELLNGPESSCEDGVILTYTCKDCGYSYTDEWHSHRSYEKERIELDQFGSTCHGYAVLSGCFCGEYSDLSLEHALCDLDRTHTDLWIENYLPNRYYEACIYTCAVTDPEQCGLKIRYACYWVQEEGSCLAYCYETWQFGYNEQDGTCQRELTYTTQYAVNHTWETTETEGTWDGGTYRTSTELCSLCQSSRIRTWYYDANNRTVKSTEVYTNNLNDRNDKYFEQVYEWAWYESKVEPGNYLQYATRDYRKTIYAGGEEYWYENISTYDFSNGCNCTRTYTNSDGDSNSYNESCHDTVWHVTKQPGCTQDGIEAHVCLMCGETVNTYPVRPSHDWVWVSDGHYFCSDCGLENTNGASGAITMEDMTAEYGNGTHYVVGYYAENQVQFTYYVALITADGAEQFIEVEVTQRDDIRALTFSKADVAAAAEALGITEYDVRFTFVPVGADGSFDYAITLTAYSVPAEITDSTHFLLQVEPNSTYTFTVTAAELGIWCFNVCGNSAVYIELVDAEGNVIVNDGWYTNPGLSYKTEANVTLTLKVHTDQYDDGSYIYMIADFVPAV